MADIISLPAELILNILLSIPGDQLPDVCSTDKRLNQLCRDPYLWSLKLGHDFPGLSAGDHPHGEYMAAVDVHTNFISHTSAVPLPDNVVGVFLAPANRYPIEVMQYSDDVYMYAPIVSAVASEDQFNYSLRRVGDYAGKIHNYEFINRDTLNYRVGQLINQGYRWWSFGQSPIPVNLIQEWNHYGVIRITQAYRRQPGSL